MSSLCRVVEFLNSNCITRKLAPGLVVGKKNMKLLHLLCLIGLAVQTIGLQKAEDLQVTGNPHIAPKPLDAATAGGQVSARRQRLLFFPLSNESAIDINLRLRLVLSVTGTFL